MTTVHEHEDFKMMRAREDGIRTLMQFELEACLEEISWSIRCYKCEVLGCPQEEYPAGLLPTLPPSYEDNIQSRLIMAEKGIFPASLKIILESEYQLPVLCPVPEISVQPDSVIGEHRAGENSTSSEYDPSLRRAAVVTRSEEPGTPPHSPAISTGSEEPGSPPQSLAIRTGSGPEGEIFPFEASRDVLLRSKCTSLEEDYILLQVQPDGMDDSNNATTSQDATREESGRLLFGQQQRMAAWSTDYSKQFHRGRLL